MTVRIMFSFQGRFSGFHGHSDVFKGSQGHCMGLQGRYRGVPWVSGALRGVLRVFNRLQGCSRALKCHGRRCPGGSSFCGVSGVC